VTASKQRLALRVGFPSGLILFAVLGSACSLQASASPPPPTEAPLPSTQAPSASPATGTTVVYTKDGDILVWDHVTGESRNIFNSGDVIRVELSDDGQLLAFLRRSIVQTGDADWRDQSALWVVDLTGENPRELVSGDTLRDLLGASERDSSNIPEMAWIRGTHRLLYNGWTYLVMAEGESHAIPRGLYSVDADEGTQQVLVNAESILRFVVSPDGGQVALLSPTALAFVDADGSNLRPDALTYAQVGVPGPLFPVGVWTEDSQAFVMTEPLEGDPAADIDLAISLVPADGSAPDELASVSRSHPGSVTFSPDGRSAAYIQYTDEVPPDIAGWFITPLGEGPGPLAIPRELEPGYPSLHWSPDGRAFTGALAELCPGATNDSEICESPISRGVSAIQWLDATHLLLLTRDPSALFLITLDPSGQMDATTEPIAVWPLEEFVGPQSFSAVEAGEG
jgi:Tol biopolymer transport system component